MLQAIVYICKNQRVENQHALNHLYLELLKRSLSCICEDYLKVNGASLVSSSREELTLIGKLQASINQSTTIREIEKSMSQYHADSNALFSEYNRKSFMFKASNHFLPKLEQCNELLNKHKSYFSEKPEATNPVNLH